MRLIDADELKKQVAMDTIALNLPEENVAAAIKLIDKQRTIGIDIACCSRKKISEVPAGEVIKSYIGVEYIVLEHNVDGTRVIRKDLLSKRMEFDSSNNNYAYSDIDKYLNDKYLKNEIIPGFGEGNVMNRDINLLSLDGFDNYGHYTAKIGLLTLDDYRKYRKNILNKNMESRWWLATPDSTISGSGSRYVRYVDSVGGVGYRGCDCVMGVRPDLLLEPSILVYFVEE